MKILWVESRDFSQADKDITTCKSKQIHKMTPIFSQNNNLSENSCHFWKFAQFSKQSFARLKSKHFSQFFWWEVNLRGLRGLILQKVQDSVVERQKKKFCYPSFNFGKEDTIIRIVSVWDRSCYSTHRIFFLEHKMRPIFFINIWRRTSKLSEKNLLYHSYN